MPPCSNCTGGICETCLKYARASVYCMHMLYFSLCLPAACRIYLPCFLLWFFELAFFYMTCYTQSTMRFECSLDERNLNVQGCTVNQYQVTKDLHFEELVGWQLVTFWSIVGVATPDYCVFRACRLKDEQPKRTELLSKDWLQSSDLACIARDVLGAGQRRAGKGSSMWEFP